MEKCTYSKMKIRFDIIMALINNKNARSLDDLSLVPLLVDYVEKGDPKIFENYARFVVFEEERKRCELDNISAF